MADQSHARTATISPFQSHPKRHFQPKSGYRKKRNRMLRPLRVVSAVQNDAPSLIQCEFQAFSFTLPSFTLPSFTTPTLTPASPAIQPGIFSPSTIPCSTSCRTPAKTCEPWKLRCISGVQDSSSVSACALSEGNGSSIRTSRRSRPFPSSSLAEGPNRASATCFLLFVAASSFAPRPLLAPPTGPPLNGLNSAIFSFSAPGLASDARLRLWPTS